MNGARRSSLIPPEFLKIEKSTRGHVAILKLTGPIGLHTFEALEALLCEMFKNNQFRIALDLGEVRYVSSAGAGVLMNAFSECRENKGDLCLANPSTEVMDVFEVLSLTDVIPIAGSVEAALQILEL